MWELDYKESWAQKNWCFWTVVLEKTLESPMDCKEIQLVNHKRNQSWIFIGRTDAEAETDVKNQLFPWGWERLKAGGEGDNRGWDGWRASLTQWRWVWVNSGGCDAQGGLACCSPWGHKVLDMTEQLNWTDSKSGLVWCISVFRIVRTHLYIVCMFLPLLMTFMTHYLNRTYLLLKDNFILKFCAT